MITSSQSEGVFDFSELCAQESIVVWKHLEASSSSLSVSQVLHVLARTVHAKTQVASSVFPVPLC
jgi:hypothetical protein